MVVWMFRRMRWVVCVLVLWAALVSCDEEPDVFREMIMNGADFETLRNERRTREQTTRPATAKTQCRISMTGVATSMQVLDRSVWCST